MSKAVMYGLNRGYVPNARMDQRYRHKQWARKQTKVQREKARAESFVAAVERAAQKIDYGRW